MIKLNHNPTREEFSNKFYYEPARGSKVAVIFNPKTDEWVGIGYYLGDKKCGVEIHGRKERKNALFSDLYKCFMHSLIDNDNIYEITEEEIAGLLTMNELVG